MIDLHCHLLPGVDDGPSTMEGSVEMARALSKSGVRDVAATPHCRADHPGVVPGELSARCAELSAELDARGIDLGIVQAGEVDLLWALEASDEDLRTVSFRGLGDDLLMETPYGPLTSNFEDLLFKTALRGYRLLLAHPERNPSFHRDPERLEALAARGTLLQITASSLLRSPRSSRSAKLAHRLLATGHAHLIASDSHGAAVPGRAGLAEGALVAGEMVGRPLAEWLVERVPRAILLGKPIPPAPPSEQRRSGLRGRRRTR